MREHENEPIPGLPERLPRGETILWQGTPAWRPLARRGFHLPLLAVYFAGLAAWRGGTLAAEGAASVEIAAGTVWLLLLGAVPVALLALFARFAARTTLYTVTDRRLVMRVGVALPLTVNLPLSVIRRADLWRYAEGGDILLELEPPHRVSWVALWPHVAGLRFGRPRPVLRALPDAEAAAQALAGALAAQAEHAGQRVTLTPARRPADVRTPVPA
jgi:hypothetical protein